MNIIILTQTPPDMNSVLSGMCVNKLYHELEAVAKKYPGVMPIRIRKSARPNITIRPDEYLLEDSCVISYDECRSINCNGCDLRDKGHIRINIDSLKIGRRKVLYNELKTVSMKSPCFAAIDID